MQQTFSAHNISVHIRDLIFMFGSKFGGNIPISFTSNTDPISHCHRPSSRLETNARNSWRMRNVITLLIKMPWAKLSTLERMACHRTIESNLINYDLLLQIRRVYTIYAYGWNRVVRLSCPSQSNRAKFSELFENRVTPVSNAIYRICRQKLFEKLKKELENCN